MFDFKKFGSLIRAGRALKGINQSETAELLGISTVAISNYETGKSLPTADTLSLICETLSIDPAELLGLDHQKNESS